MRSKWPAVVVCAALALTASAPAALAQLSKEEAQKDYLFCTFPVPNINFSVKHVNDVIAACTALINTSGGSAENRALVHLQRGAMYRRLRKFELALADFTMSIHYDPNSAYAYTGRGNAHRGLHQVDETIADHSKAIELKPDYAEAYNNRGNAWDDKKDYKQAIADFDTAIRLNPRYAVAFRNRAASKSDHGDTAGALADYDAAIAIDPHYAIAFYNRANVKLERGDKKGAIADLRAALKINPDFEEAAGMLKELKAKSQAPSPLFFAAPGRRRLSPAAALERTEGARDAKGPDGPAGLDASRHRGLSKPALPQVHQVRWRPARGVGGLLREVSR